MPMKWIQFQGDCFQLLLNKLKTENWTFNEEIILHHYVIGDSGNGKNVSVFRFFIMHIFNDEYLIIVISFILYGNIFGPNS